MICPECKGDCVIKIAFPINPKKCTYPCLRCHATGIVSDEMGNWIKAGKELKAKRFEKRITLRDAAKILDKKHHSSLTLLSNMENGFIEPDLSLYDDLLDIRCSSCPECGCKDVIKEFNNYLGEGSRVCQKCRQEWWVDIDYSH